MRRRVANYRKPTQTPRAAWLSAAVPGLKFAAFHGEGAGAPIDAMTRLEATVTGAPTWTVGQYGLQRGSYSTTKYDRYGPVFTGETYPNWAAALYNSTGGTPQQIVGHQYTGSGNPLQSLIINGANGVWQVRDNAGTLIQVTTSGITANDGAWHVLMGVSLANNSHQVYFDGVLITSSSSSVSTTTFDNISVGASLRNTVSNGFLGVIATALIGTGSVPNAMNLYQDLISGRFIPMWPLLSAFPSAVATVTVRRQFFMRAGSRGCN